MWFVSLCHQSVIFCLQFTAHTCSWYLLVPAVTTCLITPCLFKPLVLVHSSVSHRFVPLLGVSMILVMLPLEFCQVSYLFSLSFLLWSSSCHVSFLLCSLKPFFIVLAWSVSLTPVRILTHKECGLAY